MFFDLLNLGMSPLLGDGKSEIKSRAFAVLTFKPDVAAVHFHQAFGDVES
jgi:hypothetical protein